MQTKINTTAPPHPQLEAATVLVAMAFLLASFVQTLDSAIHRFKFYPVDNAIGFLNTYPLDSDLSGG